MSGSRTFSIETLRRAEALIQVKFARRRFQNLADVVELVRLHNLDEAFLKQLDPRLWSDYLRCLGEIQRQIEYESRQ